MATPIGNLSDLGQRAASVLGSVGWVAAEDTRVSRVLLDHVGCRPAMVALHQHNEVQQSAALVARLLRGERGALISDAGTPAISDPGARLVAAAHAAGVPVVPVPGASAPVTLLSAAGLEPGPFLFEGFLPPRPRARDQRLADLRAHCDALGAHLVLFEAPHRIVRTLDALAATYGPDRPLAIGRELTKRHEEVERTTTGRAPAWLQARSTRQRGEFVLAVGAPAAVGTRATAHEDDADAAGGTTSAPAGAERSGTARALPDPRTLLTRLLEDLPVSRAVRLARDLTGAAHRDLYALALQLRPGDALSDDR